MDSRSLAASILGCGPGDLKGFHEFDDGGVSVIAPDGRKLAFPLDRLQREEQRLEDLKPKPGGKGAGGRKSQDLQLTLDGWAVPVEEIEPEWVGSRPVPEGIAKVVAVRAGEPQTERHSSVRTTKTSTVGKKTSTRGKKGSKK